MDQWPDAAKEVIAFQDNHLVLLALDAAESDTDVRRSSIAGARRGVFAARDFVAGEYILPFYGQVIITTSTLRCTSRIPMLLCGGKVVVCSRALGAQLHPTGGRALCRWVLAPTFGTRWLGLPTGRIYLCLWFPPSSAPQAGPMPRKKVFLTMLSSTSVLILLSRTRIS